MKKIILIIFFLGLIKVTFAQTAGFNKNYSFLHSDNLVADKDFYLLTVIEHTPAVDKLIGNNSTFQTIHNNRINI